MPAAWQADAPFGANTGGVNAAFAAVMPQSQFDSWLTVRQPAAQPWKRPLTRTRANACATQVGITDGDSSGALGTIGIDWDRWSQRNGLRKLPRYRWHLGCILLRMPATSLSTGTDNGAIFWMNPSDGPGGSVQVAQLTTRTGTQWTMTCGMQGKSVRGEDWEENNISFSSGNH